MNVTATNAAGLLEEWVDLLDRCEFYAVDQEMTGINGDKPLDREGALADHYDNVSTAVKRFSAFQYGVCLFERKDGKKRLTSSSSSSAITVATAAALGSDTEYIVRPFSFWLLKDDSQVTLETSAIKFLIANHMNYQYWLENGFTYGNEDVNACPAFDSFDEKERAWIKASFEAINQWYDNPPPPPPAPAAAETAAADGTAAPAVAPAPVVVPDEFCLDTIASPRADVYLHHLLYAQCPSYLPHGYLMPSGIHSVEGRQTAFNAVPTKSLMNGRDPRWCRVWFRRLPNNGTIEAHALANPIAPKMTFYPFFKALVAAKKPHVGHNYFTDLMFQINQHHATALPSSYPDFRSLVGQLFPTIYDTKVLVSMLNVPVKNTSLGNAFAELTARAKKNRIAKKFKFPMGFNDLQSPNLQVAHDGAYDAFMTGVVFLYILSVSSNANNAVDDEENDDRARKRTRAEVIAATAAASPAPHVVKMALPVPGADKKGAAAAAPTTTPSADAAVVPPPPPPTMVEDGIAEGYATYEGVIAQFAAKYWMALRKKSRVPMPRLVGEGEEGDTAEEKAVNPAAALDVSNDLVKAREDMMCLAPPPPPAPTAEEATAEKKAE